MEKGSPWVSIQGPILFNISISNLFLANNDVNFVSCAYNNTIYQTTNNADHVISHSPNFTRKSFLDLIMNSND